jgi:RHS repeat-associated protein
MKTDLNKGKVSITYDAAAGYQYQYFLKDHLGDTRVTFDQTGTVLQTNAYDPFGYTIAELSHSTFAQGEGNKYLYNDYLRKQIPLQDEFGLEWLDYGARFYDASVGRWWSVNPLAEKSRRWSPYTYCYNNPLRFIDPDGMSATKPDWWVDGNSGQLIHTNSKDKPHSF